MPCALSASTNAFLPPLPQVSVEWMTAHSLTFSAVVTTSAITFDEYRPLGGTRKIQGLLAGVRLGSLPTMTAGIFALAMVGEAACTCVLRKGPSTATTFCETSLE